MTTQHGPAGPEVLQPFQGVDVAASLVDASGTIIGWSEQATELLGYRRDQIVGRPAAALLAQAATGGTHERLCPAACRSGGVLLRHASGKPVRAVLRVHPLTGADGGRISVILGIADEKARRSQLWGAVLEGLYFQSTVGLAVHGADMRVMEINPTLARMGGIPAAEILGRRLGEVQPHFDAAGIERSMRQVLSTGEPMTFEGTGRTRAHPVHSRVMYSSAFPLNADGGKASGVGRLVMDITDQHHDQERLTLLNQAGTRIGTTFDIPRTAAELADVVVPRFADFLTVDLLAQVQAGDEPPAGPVSGEVTMVCAALRSPHGSEAPPGLTGVGQAHDFGPESPHAVALAAGRPVLESAVDLAAPWLAAAPAIGAAVRGYGIHSLMVVPLQMRGVILGTATFGRWKDADPFTPADLSLADELGTEAAVRIDNARRYHRERLAALTLQRNLLPHRLPVQSALEVASRYLPADTETGVGGDWFDVIPLSGARVALVVGDVVGHGIYAAATMGRLQAAVQTLAGLDLPPDEVLGHLDDLVGRIAGEDPRRTDHAWSDIVTGATCLYAVYDPVERRLTAARAGHPPPLTVAPGAAAEVVPIPAGPPLGVGGFPFESVDVELPRGTRIGLYTDGFFAAGRADVDDVISELGSVIAESTGDLEETCDEVIEALLPAPPVDDTAFLLARTKALGTNQVASWDLSAVLTNVARARQLVGEQLTGWGLEEIAFTAELVVSELVTNAIRHGSGPVRLRLIRDRSLLCEVSDLSHTSPHLRRAATNDEGGRGLYIVARLTRDWGARYTAAGKTVWGELPFRPGEIPADIFSLGA